LSVKIRFFAFKTVILVLWRVGELALLQAWVCVSACAACKCANCAVPEFQNILCGGEKNIKHWVGLRVGLLAVPFEYVRYVGHLSKWFVFVLMFKFWSVSLLWNGRPTIGYNVLQICDVRAFHQKC
jgi:hypothetical protein